MVRTMRSEDGGVDREELAAFLATAPEHLRHWADEQLAGLAAGDDDSGAPDAEPESPDERSRRDGAESADGGAGTGTGGDDRDEPGEAADPPAADGGEPPDGGRPGDGDEPGEAADVEDLLADDEGPEPDPESARTVGEESRNRPRTPSRLQRRTGVSRVNLVLVMLLAAAVVIIIRQMGQTAGDGAASEMTMPSNHPAVTSSADPSAIAQMDEAEPVDTEQETRLKTEADADSTNVSARQQLGEMYLKAALYQDAITYLQQILDVEPDNLDALLTIGVAEYQSNQYEDAEKHWLRATELAPDVAEPWYNLGLLYMARTPPDAGRATECWNKVLTIAPDSDMAASVRAHQGRRGSASAVPTAATGG